MSRIALSLFSLTLMIGCGPDTNGGGGHGGGGHDLGGSGGGDDGGPAGDDGGGNDQAVGSEDGGDLGHTFSDGASAYDDLGPRSDAGQCVPPNVATGCPNALPGNAGCLTKEDCGSAGTGNGLDDDCNGKVDDGCACTPGQVEPCFLGPPGKHKVGACTDGTQTCVGAEFGAWGDCKGSISPTAETCDKLDNDCNGCVDDGLCCDATLACPSSVPDALPYSTINYDGTQWFKGNASSWSWTADGGPCDQLFKTTTGSPPQQSFKLSNDTTAKPSLQTTLSGDYKVTMTVTDNTGKKYMCTFVQHVTGPGLRFELCWDHTGPNDAANPGGPGADLDLHVHKSCSGAGCTNWFSTSSGNDTISAPPNPDDCDYYNCTADNYQSASSPVPNWGLANSNISECQNTPKGSTWQSIGHCANPRLDIDNINTVGKPENTNIDDPAAGQVYRALVHYYGQDGGQSSVNVTEHPIVNIYCNGRLTATYGQAPDLVSGFTNGSGWNAGQMWRVADVSWMLDATGKPTCAVSAVHPPGTTSGYYVTNNNSSF